MSAVTLQAPGHRALVEVDVSQRSPDLRSRLPQHGERPSRFAQPDEFSSEKCYSV